MDKEQRRKQSQETKDKHNANHLNNLRIFHGWLGKLFFHKGQPQKPIEKNKNYTAYHPKRK